jgi:hypothetical protein
VEVEELDGDEGKHAKEVGRDDEVVANVQAAKEEA